MSESTSSEAGNTAASGQDTNQTGVSEQGTQNAMTPHYAEAAAAAQERLDAEKEDLDSAIANLPDGEPGSEPVSIDGTTGETRKVTSTTKAAKRTPEYDSELSINPREVLEAETPQPEPAPEVVETKTEPVTEDDVTEEVTEPGKRPQFRFRPNNDRDQKILGVAKSLGCSIEEATEIVRSKEGNSQPVEAAQPDLSQLDSKRGSLISEADQLEAQLDEVFAEQEKAEESLDFDAMKAAKQKAAEVRGKLKANREALKVAEREAQAAQSVQAERTQFDRAWETSEAEAAKAYASDGYGDVNSPLAKAAAAAHALLVAAKDPRVHLADYPGIYWARGKEFALLNPSKFGALAPAPASPPASSQVSSNHQPQPVRMQPARAAVQQPASSAPSAFSKAVREAVTTSDLNDLIQAL